MALADMTSLTRQPVPARQTGQPSESNAATLEEIYRRLSVAFGPQHWWPGETRTEVIVGAILTQHTAWANVEQALARLKAARALDFAAIHSIAAESLAELIKPAGTFRVKARRLKAFAARIMERFDGDLDRLFDGDTDDIRRELLGVKGIGPETADAILLYAGGRAKFVVDAYTQRILRRHFIVGENSSYPETQAMFEFSLPASVERFGEYHALLVRLGKEFCRPRARCQGCPLDDLRHDATR